MEKQKTKFFDLITIFLTMVLAGLILVIGVILFWKEKNIKVEFDFFNQIGINQEYDSIIKNDKIVIFFSGPIQKESVLSNLKIEPKVDFETNWKSGYQLEIIVKDNLVPDFNYKLSFENFKSKWGILNEGREITFSTDPLPILEKVSPENESREIAIDQQIVFEFKEKPASQYFLKIKTNPEFEFETVETEKDNQIIIKPVVDLAFDTDYKVSAELRSKNYFDFTRKVAETSFRTKNPPVVIYSFNSEGDPIKIGTQTELQKPAILTGKYVDINLSKQNLYIFENGQELGAYKVSTGKRGMNTPTGQFPIIAKARRPWSAKYGLYMPWFIQFTYDGHGIHELPEWPSGYKEGANHLGIPVSHGCVRLGVGAAEKVYNFVETGTPIVIHY